MTKVQPTLSMGSERKRRRSHSWKVAELALNLGLSDSFLSKVREDLLDNLLGIKDILLRECIISRLQ